jgi:hypothetical protein
MAKRKRKNNDLLSTTVTTVFLMDYVLMTLMTIVANHGEL